ncbi:MAG TPA: type II secretion system secretin GspD [Roseiarcus sp.]|nr:type II secretion system secretin GspD [Roseiarcus sp.]
MGEDFPMARLMRAAALFGGALVALGACNTAYLDQPRDQPQNAADIVRATDLQPHYPQQTGAVDTGGTGRPKSFSIFGWSGSSPEPAPSAAPPGAEAVDGGYTLNFENAPVANVAKSVLGDTLGEGYVIDPRVQGSITLATARPVPKKDMLLVLEDALHANNLNMVREGGGYRIVPATDATVGSVDRGAGTGVEPGFGVTVIPLQYVSGATLSKLLEGFATRPGAIRTDASGKILLVVGTGSERQSALDVVRNFDVDWLEGQSVGMYPVQNSTPEPVAAELEKIMDSGESGLGHGLVKFQPVARLNSILVVASRPEYLRAAQRWIARLDEPPAGMASVKVYKVRYGDAKQIAQLLDQIFGTGAGGGGEPATNEIAPGSGAKALTTVDRLTGGNTGANGQSTPPQPTPVSASGQSPGQSPLAQQYGAATVASLNSQLNALGLGQGQGGGPQLHDVRITADTLNNSLLIYARPDEYKLIERTLNQLDRPRLQVAIDVTIAEVRLNQQLSYGVQFFLNNGSYANTLTGVIPSLTGSLNNASGNSSLPPLSGGLNLIAGSPLAPRVVINALSQLTDVKILSNPSLVVVDNGEAVLEIGDQIPVATGSATVLSANNAVVNTVDYKNTGIILHVVPRVNSNGSVLLAVDQEISSVPQTLQSGTSNLTPTISQRKVQSQISVVSGQTVLLAGLISDEQDKSRQGIPLLSEIPYVGGAFATTGNDDVRTELIIFIRPQIIRDGADASMVAEELRSKMRGDRVQAMSIPASLNVGARAPR